MKTKQSPLDSLVSVVSKTTRAMEAERDALVIACDDVEEAFDALQAQLEKREFQYRALCTERRMEKLDAEEKLNALQAQLNNRDKGWSVQYRAMEAQRDALVDENVRLHQIIDGLRDQLALNASTVADQITRWAEANYSSSHEAQAVVEGCYDAEELGAFGSLEAFKKHAGIRDDYRADIIAAGGE